MLSPDRWQAVIVANALRKPGAPVIVELPRKRKKPTTNAPISDAGER